jgi:hypothetical protein
MLKAVRSSSICRLVSPCVLCVFQEALRVSRTTQHDAHTLHHDLHAAQKALNESSARVTALAQEKAGLKAAEVRPCCGAVIERVSLHVDSARHIPSDTDCMRYRHMHSVDAARPSLSLHDMFGVLYPCPAGELVYLTDCGSCDELQAAARDQVASLSSELEAIRQRHQLELHDLKVCLH